MKNPVLNHNISELENSVYSIRNSWGCLYVMFEDFSCLSMQDERSSFDNDVMQSLSSGIDSVINNFFDIFKSFSTLHSCLCSDRCFNADCVHCYDFKKCKELGCLYLSDVSVEDAEKQNVAFFRMNE